MSEERTNLADENAERAAESDDNTQVADAGVPGQIQYPDRAVDAERAAAFAGGKADSLDPDDESSSGWQNPADRSGEEQAPGDVTGEETEPFADEDDKA